MGVQSTRGLTSTYQRAILCCGKKRSVDKTGKPMATLAQTYEGAILGCGVPRCACQHGGTPTGVPLHIEALAPELRPELARSVAGISPGIKPKPKPKTLDVFFLYSHFTHKTQALISRRVGVTAVGVMTVLTLLHSVTSFQAPLDDARVALAAANPFASFDGAKYSHLSAADFAERHRGGYKPRYPTPPVRSLLEPTRDSSFPSTRVDWRTKGAVSKVYDQDQRGCCWAMSAARWSSRGTPPRRRRSRGSSSSAATAAAATRDATAGTRTRHTTTLRALGAWRATRSVISAARDAQTH